jgi:peptide/nickel transport system permease protein
MAFGMILLSMAVTALLAPLISEGLMRHTPEGQDLNRIFEPISTEHWLGTDELGRDTAARLVWGARVSLGVGFLSVLLLVMIGGTVGMLAGFYGGLVDDVLMGLVNVLLAIPPIFILLLLMSLLPLSVGPITIQREAMTIAVVIAALGWGGLSRLVRAEVLSLRERDFVLAARAGGAPNRRLMLNHILPNVMPVVIVAASLGLGQVILIQASLDFIGVGVQPPVPTWGNMLLNAQSYTTQSVLLVIAPGTVIMLAVLSANIFGNGLRDALDPHLK